MSAPVIMPAHLQLTLYCSEIYLPFYICKLHTDDFLL